MASASHRTARAACLSALPSGQIRSKATGGTGLGLAIVKHIAVLHGARIDLESTVGTGTTIRIIFPKM